MDTLDRLDRVEGKKYINIDHHWIRQLQQNDAG